MVTSAHAATRPDDTPGFRQYWLAEAVRLRESQWGPLQDSSETRRARALGDDFTQRLLLRAAYLGQREGMESSIRQWAGGARLAFIVLLALAILTGAGAALGALGDGSRHVNLMLALTAMLGLHALTFLFWCISSVIPYGGSHTGLGDLWLWLTRKLARGPDTALIPRALAGLLARQGALRPLLGAISHTLWLFALTAMLLTLVALLSARRYTFSWETTLLSPDVFVALTNGLGWLPSKLGFSIPPDSIIRASDGLQALPDHAHTLWSGWLIGCIVCYGLLPRLLAMCATVIKTTVRVKNLTLDTRLPGYIELRDRLDPPSVSGGIDAPAPTDLSIRPHLQPPPVISGQQTIVGLELAQDETWPPAPLPPHIVDLGVIDNRLQRQHLLDALHRNAPGQLLIVCDGRQTPDRGIITLIAELASLAEQTRVAMLTDTPRADDHIQNSTHPGMSRPATRHQLWTQQLHRAGLPDQDIYTDVRQAVTWLATRSDTTLPDTP